jgi:hypothetical protein
MRLSARPQIGQTASVVVPTIPCETRRRTQAFPCVGERWRVFLPSKVGHGFVQVGEKIGQQGTVVRHRAQLLVQATQLQVRIDTIGLELEGSVVAGGRLTGPSVLLQHPAQLGVPLGPIGLKGDHPLAAGDGGRAVLIGHMGARQIPPHIRIVGGQLNGLTEASESLDRLVLAL